MHLAGTRTATESTAGKRRRKVAETRARRRPTFGVTELEGLGERPATRSRTYSHACRGCTRRSQKKSK